MGRARLARRLHLAARRRAASDVAAPPPSPPRARARVYSVCYYYVSRRASGTAYNEEGTRAARSARRARAARAPAAALSLALLVEEPHEEEEEGAPGDHVPDDPVVPVVERLRDVTAAIAGRSDGAPGRSANPPGSRARARRTRLKRSAAPPTKPFVESKELPCRVRARLRAACVSRAAPCTVRPTAARARARTMLSSSLFCESTSLCISTVTERSIPARSAMCAIAASLSCSVTFAGGQAHRQSFRPPRPGPQSLARAPTARRAVSSSPSASLSLSLARARAPRSRTGDGGAPGDDETVQRARPPPPFAYLGQHGAAGHRVVGAADDDRVLSVSVVRNGVVRKRP